MIEYDIKRVPRDFRSEIRDHFDPRLGALPGVKVYAFDEAGRATLTTEYETSIDDEMDSSWRMHLARFVRQEHWHNDLLIGLAHHRAIIKSTRARFSNLSPYTYSFIRSAAAATEDAVRLDIVGRQVWHDASDKPSDEREIDDTTKYLVPLLAGGWRTQRPLWCENIDAPGRLEFMIARHLALFNEPTLGVSARVRDGHFTVYVETPSPQTDGVHKGDLQAWLHATAKYGSCDMHSRIVSVPVMLDPHATRWDTFEGVAKSLLDQAVERARLYARELERFATESAPRIAERRNEEIAASLARLGATYQSVAAD